MHRIFSVFRRGWILVAAGFAFSGSSFATGLAVFEQSASNAARGLAGAAAVADDASTVFYNPAGMMRLQKNELLFSLGNVFPRMSFENARGFDATGAPIGSSSSIPDKTLYVPSIFGVWVVSPDLRIGVGLNSPFGQKIEYNEGWLGRYFTTSTELKTVNFMGSAAWRVSSALSIGGGLEYQTADVARKSAIDFGSTCFGVLGPAACAGFGLLPQTQDGSVKFEASSHAFGYNLGALLEPHEGLRLGATYRSKVKHKLSGTAIFSIPPTVALLTAGGAFRSTGSSTEITLPESVSLGLAADLSPRATLLAGLIWTRSSRFDNLIVRFDNPAQPTVIEPQNWKNNYRASLGFDYRFNTAWTMHGGVVFDQSPVPDSFRNVTIPDSDRSSVNTGFTWKPSNSLSLTVSYSYAHDKNAPISQTSSSAGTLTGVFKRDTNSLGLQGAWRF